MNNIKECGVPTEIVQKENIINNPSEEVLRKAFEIPAIPEWVEVNFIPEIESKIDHSSMQVEFGSNLKNGIFKLKNNNIAVYSPEYKNEEQDLKNTQDTNKRIRNGSKPDVIKYSGDHLGFETLKNTELNSVIESGYKIDYFEIWLSSIRLTGYNEGYYPVSRLTFYKGKLELDMKEDDDKLSSEQKESVQLFFNDLKNN